MVLVLILLLNKWEARGAEEELDVAFVVRELTEWVVQRGYMHGGGGGFPTHRQDGLPPQTGWATIQLGVTQRSLLSPSFFFL